MDKNLRISVDWEDEPSIRVAGFKCWDSELLQEVWSIYVPQHITTRLHSEHWWLNHTSVHNKLYHFYLPGRIKVQELSHIEQLVDWSAQ